MLLMNFRAILVNKSIYKDRVLGYIETIVWEHEERSQVERITSERTTCATLLLSICDVSFLQH